MTSAAVLVALFGRYRQFPAGEFFLFLFIFFVAEAKPVRLSGFYVTVTFMVAIVAILRMPPSAVALASGLAVAGSVIADRKARLAHLIFNSSQSALAGGLAAQTYRWLGGVSRIDAAHLRTLILATAAACAAYFLVNSIAVTGVLSLSNHTSFFPTWFSTHGWLAATYVAFGASGLVVASLYQLVSIYALPLLLVPLLVARGVFRSYQEVSEAYLSTVRAFVTAIEAKDSYTRGHSERVAEYGTMIAKRTGMRDQELTIFHYGALLHDVGKLVVRKAVLTKPGRLEAEEYDEIKRHPVVGAQIVSEIEFLRPSLDAVLYHHERLDGSGYPAGLAGDLVPRWARIMAVADTYDAMTSTRAYRGACSRDEALAELTRFSGTQFDPEFVEAFARALAEKEQAEARPAYEPTTVPAAVS
jgi:HD-GYP domain-containing protein (c-di-GMP phosphodiesterase class II)